MTSTRARIVLTIGAVGIALAGCAPSVDVAVEERALIVADGRPANTTAPTEATPSGSAPTGGADEPDGSTLAWGTCDTYAIPSVDELGTSGWECATLDVPMDPFNDGGDLDPVGLAVTRHRATGERIGALVINPGGPGGSGLESAWAIRPGLPVDILRGYDVVSWDPRGVGSSVPSIDCGDDPDPDRFEFMAVCAENTGDIGAFLAAPYSAADLDALRVALGEEQLDFLGYSYGTIIGAAYASRWPEQVGHFVLDGTTDPFAGGPDGAVEDGFPYFADDGYPEAFDRFVELCNRSEACPMEGDTERTLDDLRSVVGDLPTNAFADAPDVVDATTLDEVIDASLTYAGDWPLLATALGDAIAGDASALAALAADVPTFESPDSSDPAEQPGGPSFVVANLVIYCAEFAALIEGSEFCDPLPTNEFTLGPIGAVDVDRDILVIGTEFDPLTPGYHAPEFAEALGDAVHVIWDGVGHTAFPGSSRCIDRIVTDHLLDGPLPENGQRCAFVDGISDDGELADILFTHDRGSAAGWMAQVFVTRGEDRDVARCIGSAVARTDDRIISHTILDVASADAMGALDDARVAC